MYDGIRITGRVPGITEAPHDMMWNREIEGPLEWYCIQSTIDRR
jgi:hypothetical protein